MTQSAHLQSMSSKDPNEVSLSTPLKTEEVFTLQSFQKDGAPERRSECMRNSARLPSEDEGNLCAIISNAEQLFDMEMAEVTVRLVLKALSDLN